MSRRLTNHKIKFRKQFAANLNEALDDKGIPKDRGRQAWLKRATGSSQPGCSRWLNGDGMPEMDQWESIAEVVGVNLPWLFFNLGPKRHDNEVRRARLHKKVSAVVAKVAAQKIPSDIKGELVEKLVKEFYVLLETELS